MGLLFLILATFGALFTVLALVRVRRFRTIAFPIMVVSWLTGELVLHNLALQVLVTALFWWGGALGDPAGRLGLALTLASWVGLLAVHLIARRSRTVLTDALAALGVGEPTWARRPGARLLPLRRSGNGFTVVRGVPYGPHGLRNLADLYVPDPRRHGGPRPMVIQVHGGSWSSGRRDTQQQPVIRHLAANGFLVAAITYRRGGRHRLPDHVEDVKRAVVWLRDHGPTHGGDPTFIAVMGASAGAHLAALAAVSGTAFQAGFDEADASVQAVIPVYGTFDLLDRDRARGPWSLRGFLAHQVVGRSPGEAPDLWNRLSPVTWARPDLPPCLVVHGRLDTLLFHEESQVFVDALRAEGAPVGYASLPGGQHAFDLFWSTRTSALADATTTFLQAAHHEVHTRSPGAPVRRGVGCQGDPAPGRPRP